MSTQRLVGNTKREADSQEVQALRQENDRLKQLVAELALKNRVLKTSVAGKESESEIWHDVSYGLTNLPPDVSPPELLLKYMRGYRGIENGLLYRRDPSFLISWLIIGLPLLIFLT